MPPRRATTHDAETSTRNETTAAEGTPLHTEQSQRETRSMEAVCGDVHRRLCEKDLIYKICMDRGGQKLSAIYDQVIRKIFCAQIARYREVIGQGTIPIADRMFTDQQLDEVEVLLDRLRGPGDGQDPPNDEFSRTAKHLLFFVALIVDDVFRDKFIQEPPPQHPFPDAVKKAAGPPAAKRMTDSTTLLTFLELDLAPAFTALVYGNRAPINLRSWVDERILAFITLMRPMYVTEPSE